MKTNKSFFLLLAFVTALGFFAQPLTAKAEDEIKVTIFYLPHRPALKILNKVEKILSKYSTVKIQRFDLSSSSSKDAMKKYNIHGHLPIIFFINGKSEFKIGERKVLFKNFPKKDSFIPTFSGDWDYEDVEKVIQRIQS